MLVVREKGLRTIPKTKVDVIEWWIDSGATTHVCKDRCWFKTYEPMEDRSVLYMGDDHFAHVYGKGSVVLEFRIIHETTTLYTPQQNGVAKRKNRPLKEMVNSMLSYLGPLLGFQTQKEILGEKAIDCIFVGYAEHSKAYRFYIIEPNDSVSINSIIELRDAIFDENRFSSTPRPKDIIPNSDESQRDDHSDDVPSEIPEPRKCKRVRKAKSYGSDFQLYLVVSDLPPGCKPLGCKWIFKRKMKVDGTINKFKARLVIKGFRQKEGIDYFDTFAPVARITTIRLLLALAAIHNLVIHQMDVKTTFLNDDFEEEVYMKQPEGFVMPGNEHKVCKLVKSLYGQ
ncbi:zinc finger, CCHC-type containing protein [Tanacetum coccineum]